MLGKLIPSFYTFLMNKKIYNTFLNILIKRKYYIFFLLLFLQMFSNKDEKVYLKYKVFKVLKSNHEAKN